MSAIPGGVDTSQQPPMTIPLRHFLVGLIFLLAGGVVGFAARLGATSGWTQIAHLHLLLVGWVGLTIMGAMTQFVPVWSGISLHSRRLASVQLWLVTGGLVGLAVGLTLTLGWLVLVGGTVLLVGIWLFVYNIGRTLWIVDDMDITERHFAIALGFFLLLSLLGISLAVDVVWPLFDRIGTRRGAVISAHATLAVFGAILTTVFGALYQLATMFTQSDLHGVDHTLRQIEEWGYPTSVLALAAARLTGRPLLGRLSGVLVAACVLGMGVILARRLYETRVDWTPMLSRYAVVVAAMVTWSLLALSAWLHDPLVASTRFGAHGSGHLLAIGVIGFVVLGTFYHVIPFIVWVHRYSDRLGLEAVPMIDDLYSDAIARVDFVTWLAGTGMIVVSDFIAVPSTLPALGGVLLLSGSGLFVWNMVRVIRKHSPHSLWALVGFSWPADDVETAGADP